MGSRSTFFINRCFFLVSNCINLAVSFAFLFSNLRCYFSVTKFDSSRESSIPSAPRSAVAIRFGLRRPRPRLP